MTLQIEPASLSDRILARLGKQRAVYVPDDMQPYGYYLARRESSLRALLRPKGCSRTKGWIYCDTVKDLVEPQAGDR